HMDVVPGKIKVRKEGDLLYGRGASDAKAPLIAMLFAAASIKEDQGTITFVGAVDEEGNATGIKNLVKNKPDIDYAVFGEPSSIQKVTIAYKGRLAINLRVNVKNSAHASAPWLAKNAIEETSSVVTELKNGLELGQEERTKGMMLTAALTEIRGGTSHNVTPIECIATLDIRIPVDMNCNDVEEKITKIVNEISAKREIEVLYSVIDETEPFEAAHNSPLVRAMTLAILDVEKKRPMLIRKTGTGDMNEIGNQLKIPVITYGPGDPHEAHTTDEKVSVNEFVKGIEILKKSLHHLKRLHDRTK
ncbi:MAG: M20/M25/M40 family metallo-hydrolase, partial [Thermoproteota archaeon]|nr:M20/M25/M40 family metallo-hydrolase [Thermoproteota archaeon]